MIAGRASRRRASLIAWIEGWEPRTIFQLEPAEFEGLFTVVDRARNADRFKEDGILHEGTAFRE